MHQNKLKHAQGLFKLCDKVNLVEVVRKNAKFFKISLDLKFLKFDKNDESEEISMSFSSNEGSDQENDELVAADKHAVNHDVDFDDADDLGYFFKPFIKYERERRRECSKKIKIYLPESPGYPRMNRTLFSL